jgi:hypothetical protein
MTMFSDDPTWPAAVLLLVAAICFVALRIREEGKYLIWGLSATALAVVVLAAEWMWVTDAERIEAVVYDLRRALLASDVDGVLAHLTPDAQYVQSGESSWSPDETRSRIRGVLDGSKFDMVRIRELQTSAGRLTKRGKAEFKAFVRGTVEGPLGFVGSGASDSTWSLGFEQTKPGVWKVNRITPVSMPPNAPVLNPESSRRGFGYGHGDPAPHGGPGFGPVYNGRHRGPIRLDRNHLGGDRPGSRG